MTRQVVVFDVDHTLVSCNSSFRFGLFLYRNGFLSFFTLIFSLFDYMRHVCFGMSMNLLHKKSFERVFLGKSSAEIYAFAEQFLTESLLEMIYVPILERVVAAQKKGDEVVLLSSSPEFLILAIAKLLHITRVGATKYECDSNGKFVRLGEIMEGEAKATFLKQFVKQCGLPLSATVVYSDSDLDLPLLQIAGKPVGVVPNRRLRRICRRLHWEVIS
jgi:HAD superfamily hydrolase (TIGR01490 family)